MKHLLTTTLSASLLAMTLTLAGCAEKQPERPVVSVTVLGTNIVRLNGARTSTRELTTHIQKVRADAGSTPRLAITCRSSTPYSELKPVIYTGIEAGCWQISIRTQTNREPPYLIFMQGCHGPPTVRLSVDLARTNTWVGEREVRTNLTALLLHPPTNAFYNITLFADPTTTAAQIVDTLELCKHHGVEGCDLMPRESGLQFGVLHPDD